MSGLNRQGFSPDGYMFLENWGGAAGGYYERLYYVKDHPPQRRRASLGSTRVTISTVETGNNVAYASDYYPFGESIREFQVGTKGGKYKFTRRGGFTEKEPATKTAGKRDAESSYDYGACPDREALADRIGGARYYNNKLGVWLSADPLAEKYPGFNPFNYCINNPLRLIDPTGMSFEDGWTTTYKANWNGDDSPDGKKKIGIDPGHGDHNNSNKQVDPGAVNGNDYEKDIVLEISNSVKNTLLDAGYDVLQTREGDVESAGNKLAWRIKKVESSEMLVSIHVNADEKGKANGFSVLYNGNNAESKSLASAIMKENLLLKNIGCKERNDLYLLKQFKGGPAVLVEAGFISNQGDLGILKGKAGEIGQAIGKGIINYLGDKK